MSIKKISPMGFQLHVLDPFIVTFHHDDLFPKGNRKMEPEVMPEGKHIGEDFDMQADWRMYYGDTVPGFPVHPHRGFETVTLMIKGFADHFDSKGSKGRYGQGDVQWMTAGAGVQHSEMFPLLNDDKENPMELFQVWLNLPKKDKFAKPDYKMFWNEQVPTITEKDQNGNLLEITIVAGEYKGTKSLDPLPSSWAYDRNNHVGIWLIKLEPNAEFTLPAVSSTLNRVLYHYRGASIAIEEMVIAEKYEVELTGDEEVHIKNGNGVTQLLLLEGEPINEPVAASGPFVLNTMNEVKQAYYDYQKTCFGGWPWSSHGPVNDKEAGRFASYYDRKEIEYPPK